MSKTGSPERLRDGLREGRHIGAFEHDRPDVRAAEDEVLRRREHLAFEGGRVVSRASFDQASERAPLRHSDEGRRGIGSAFPEVLGAEAGGVVGQDAGNPPLAEAARHHGQLHQAGCGEGHAQFLGDGPLMPRHEAAGRDDRAAAGGDQLAPRRDEVGDQPFGAVPDVAIGRSALHAGEPHRAPPRCGMAHIARGPGEGRVQHDDPERGPHGLIHDLRTSGWRAACPASRRRA